MHDITVIVHLTLGTIEIEIVIRCHTLETNTCICSLSEKLSHTIIQIVVKRKQANR